MVKFILMFVDETTNNGYVWFSVICSSVSTLAVIIGSILALCQWRKNTQQKRADYVYLLTDKIRSDPNINFAMHLIDYTELWYKKEFHGSGKLESQIDSTLSYFSYICYLKSTSIINKNDFKFFEYELERILVNEQIQDYLYNLHYFSQRQQVPMVFKSLLEYGKKMGYFGEDFFDKHAWEKSDKYHRYINY